MSSTPLPAFFGHDPNPARDFVLEVNALQQRLFKAINGIAPTGADTPEPLRAVSVAIDRAMTFRVGGDTDALLAKQTLRELQVQADIARTRVSAASAAVEVSAVDIDELAQEIRRVDGNHDLGAGALAEALAPYIQQQIDMHVAAAGAQDEEPAPAGAMKPIPVKAAGEIAKRYGYDQVIVLARRVGTAPAPYGEHVTTYGRNAEHCSVAAGVGAFLEGSRTLTTPPG